MLEQIDSQTITISPEAAKAVVDILAEKELEGYALRIYVSGGGCCGAQFGMALDNNFRDVDTTIDASGIKLVVDNVSMEYLNGASIDYVNDPQHGAGFLVNSPSVKGHDHDGESCACGGGCSCNN
jgi:iron-sulfur cluster assembly accessory protein